MGQIAKQLQHMVSTLCEAQTIPPKNMVQQLRARISPHRQQLQIAHQDRRCVLRAYKKAMHPALIILVGSISIPL